ncbi:cytochrome C oxidase subunit IV family protein [Thiolapillus sp.]
MEDKKFIRPCTIIYLLLLALTVTTWFIGTKGFSGMQISLMVLGFALIKGQLIGDYFMGLKQVAGFWRWTVTLWLILVGCLVSYAFSLNA